MASSLFKEGDIIAPKKGRRSSNYYTLGNLEKLKITKVIMPNWSGEKPKVEAIILKGTSYYDGFSTKRKGTKVVLYFDAIEKSSALSFYPIC